MNFVFVYSDLPEDNFRVHIRILNIAEAIQRTGFHQTRLLPLSEFSANTSQAANICQNSDVIVLYQYFFGSVLSRAQYWKARKKKIILDFDQPLNYLSPSMPEYQIWMRPQVNLSYTDKQAQYVPCTEPLPIEQFRLGLRTVDKACVPSARLADDWSQYGRIVRLPDFINTDQYLVVPRKDVGVVNIGLECHGLSLGLLDGIGVLSALKNVCELFQDIHIFFLNCHHFHEEEIPLPVGKYSLMDNVFVENWPGLLSKMDVGLLPVGGMVALRGSPLRALEFMALKIPWIASDFPPFREVGRYGVLVQNDAVFWRSAITEIISNYEIYKRGATGEPFLFSLSQDIQENIDKVLSTYLDE